MRQIKFRGKRVDNGEWIYGDLIQVPENILNGFETQILVFEGIESGEPLFEQYEVIPETVGQFTGLKDKNGKPIYEGDILKSWYSRDTTGKDIVTFNYPVEFEATHDSAGFNIEFLYNAEVIGNIHDNPELLSHDKD